MNNLNKKVTSNLFWRLFERFGAQGVTFVVSIILARILDPTVYGLVALVTMFTTILQVFVDSGFGTALIQKKDADDLDFSSVFYFNITFSVLLYAVMFFVAPLISLFFNQEELTLLIRVLSLSLIISGVKNVQQAYVSRNMMFKRFFFATLAGTICAAVIGIALAYLGFGVWALVAQYLINLAVDTLVLWVVVKWRPKRMFSFSRLKILFSFGWKLLVSAILDTTYKEARSLIIGKKYSKEDLAYYNRGQQLPNVIVTNINTSIDSILLPAMSSKQDDKERVKAMMRRSIKVSTYIMMPMMVGLAVCAEPLVRIVLTDKWLPCVLYLRIFCITYAFYPIHTANLNAIKALGRSDYFLDLKKKKKIVGFSAIFITMFISVEAMTYSLLVTSVLHQLINSWPNKKLLGYGYLDQIKDMLPQILISVVMGAIVYGISFIPLPTWVLLIIQIHVGIIIYFGFSVFFKIDSFVYLKNNLKSFLKKPNKNKENNI